MLNLTNADTVSSRNAVMYAMKNLDCESIGEALDYALFPNGKSPNGSYEKCPGGVLLKFWADGDESEGLDDSDLALKFPCLDEAFEWELATLLALTECDTPCELGFKHDDVYGWIPETWNV